MERIFLAPGKRSGHITAYLRDSKGTLRKLPDEIAQEAMKRSKRSLSKLLRAQQVETP